MVSRLLRSWTNYLKPAVVTVYCTNGIPTPMISRGRLRPDPTGNVEFLKAPFELNRTPGVVDNVVLSRARVTPISSRAVTRRNLETAQLVRDQYIHHGN